MNESPSGFWSNPVSGVLEGLDTTVRGLGTADARRRLVLRGAKRMAKARVIVKRLGSIENLGSMNVNCADKTGFTNPIDDAIRSHRPFDMSGYEKVSEIPYDFLRKRLGILVAHDDAQPMVTKGALRDVLAVCTPAEDGTGSIVDISLVRDRIQRQFEEFSGKGLRTLGVARRRLGAGSTMSRAVEVPAAGHADRRAVRHRDGTGEGGVLHDGKIVIMAIGFARIRGIPCMRWC